MAVTVQGINDQITKANADVQLMVDAVTNNPIATQPQLQQISDNLVVLQTTINTLASRLGVILPASAPSTGGSDITI
jgi:hypothetical protein